MSGRMGGDVPIAVDGEVVFAREGANLLDALLDLGFHVPHICRSVGDARPAPACRLCFVEIEGRAHPVCACEVAVRSGMRVATGTERCNQLASRALRLLAGEHEANCGSCSRRGNCPFRKLADLLRVPLPSLLRKAPQREGAAVGRSDDCWGAASASGGVSVTVDHGKCVLCGKCVRACGNAGHGFVGLLGRGGATRIAIDVDLPGASGVVPCATCRLCADACPVGAIGWAGEAGAGASAPRA